MQFIDTHCHLDGEEFRDDLDAVVTRAREAGVAAIGVPGINLESLDTVLELCRRYPYFCYPMLGLWTSIGVVSLRKNSWRLSKSRCVGL